MVVSLTCGNQDNMRSNFNKVRAELVEVYGQVQMLLFGEQLLSDPNLRIGSQPKRIAHDLIHYRCVGILFKIQAGEISFTPTVHDIADPDAAPREAIYLITVTQTDPTPLITKGPDALAGQAVVPDTPADHFRVGEVTVQHDGTAPFIANADSLLSAHLSTDFRNDPFGDQQMPGITSQDFTQY